MYAWAGEDPARLRAARDAEAAEAKPRTSMIAELERRIRRAEGAPEGAADSGGAP